MKLSKQEFVRLLHSQGNNAVAQRVETDLPDDIDTDRDRAALEAAGLSHDRLMATLASAGMPRIIG